MSITCTPSITAQRRGDLSSYFAGNVLHDKFVCASYQACKSSHSGTFFEGQLHHVGEAYDLEFDKTPFRVVVVGQEYGHGPARIPMEARRQMIIECSLASRFKAEPGRNDAFALVDYLLCSAIPGEGGKQGKATRDMKKNCRIHFRRAMEILEPVVVVVQGKNFWPWVSGSFDEAHTLTQHLHKAKLGTREFFVASFTHPSAHVPYNWGLNERQPYLLEVIAPTIAAIRNEVLG